MDPYAQILKELRSLRDEVASMKLNIQPVMEKKMCKGVTGKGTPCKNGATHDSDYCRMHCEKVDRPERPKKVKKMIKPMKIQPEHTHGIGEIPNVPCPLCETHGDVMDPMLTECDFEADEQFENRLKEILAH